MQESISVRLERASAVIRGWSNYFKIAHNFSQVAHGLDHKAYWIAVKAICRKEDISTAQCLRKYRLPNTIGVHEDCALARFQDTASTYYYRVAGAVSTRLSPAVPGRRRMGGGFRPPRPSPARLRRPQVEGFGSRRLSLPWLRGRGYVQDLARGPYRTCQPLCQPRNGEQLGQHPDALSAMPQAQDCEGINGLRIIWKAGCLETCTSGLGLGSGCNSPAYTTSSAAGNNRQGLSASRSLSTPPIWENFCGLFQAINEGNETLGIPAYNGGLFAPDAVLERLQVPDAVCDYFRDLGQYDYRPAHEAAIDAEEDAAGTLVDVDILGHIFEQSITDLEKIRTELDEATAPLDAEKHKSRRKKEGAFYTPAFITRYNVSQALGGVLRDRFERLRREHHEAAKATARAVLEDPGVYQLDKLTRIAT